MLVITWLLINGEPEAEIKSQRHGQNTMNLFTNNLAEVKLTYSQKIPVSDRISINCSKDVDKTLRLFYEDIGYKESFYILLLSRSNKVLGYNLISQGGISGTITDIRLIFQAAIKSNSSAIILAHNHPSGNTNPSEADKKITKKLVDGGKLLDISVLDHIILTEETFFSFADQNLI